MWAKKLPNSRGWYWFYGYLFNSKKKKELTIIHIWKVSNGFVYLYMGNLISEQELDGYFQKIIEPRLPKEQ